MGCGVSKKTKDKINSYSQKIEELNELNAQLVQQIAELKDLKGKRKPIYVVADQEIDDLYIFKTELDKRFEKLEQEITRIQGSMNIVSTQAQGAQKRWGQKKEFNNAQEEEQWLKLMGDDHDVTLKQFNEAILEDLSQKIKSQENVLQAQASLNQEAQLPNILADIQSTKKIEGEQTLSKQGDKGKKSVQEIQKSLANVLGEDLKQMHDEIRNKLFNVNAEGQGQVGQNSGLVVNQIQFELGQKEEQRGEEGKCDPPILATEKVTKSKRPTYPRNGSNTQQHFYSKQQGPPKKGGKQKYQI